MINYQQADHSHLGLHLGVTIYGDVDHVPHVAAAVKHEHLPQHLRHRGQHRLQPEVSKNISLEVKIFGLT